MIYYEPNKNWFRDIRHLTTSWTIQKIFRGVLIIGGVAAVICTVFFYLDLQPKLNWGVFSLLGIVLSILLVFRTNTAYDRWWEGRNQWGALVNHTRSFAITLHSALPPEDKENRDFFAKHISNFCIALGSHLRDGANIESLIRLSEGEKKQLKKSQHIPNQIALFIYMRMQQIYRKGELSDSDMINLKPHHQAMIDILGACERIKKTPVPFS